MPAILELQTFYNAINKPVGGDQHVIGHFNVFKIEDILLSRKRKATYSRRSFYKVSLITGHNKLHFADNFIEVDGTALVFTNPTIPYFWDTISEKQVGYMCIFTESFFNRSGSIKDYPVFQFLDAAVVPLTGEQIPQFNALFAKMHQELQGSYIYKYDLLRNQLLEVIHEAQKIQPATNAFSMGSNASERITAQFAELLERQFPIELPYQVVQLTTPSQFANHLNVHVNHLNKALREITGQTTSQLIANRILQEAKVLLRATNWSIAEIAFSLGFNEPNHFSSFFKTRTKTNAKEYRQPAID